MPRRQSSDGIDVIRVGRSLFEKHRILARSIDSVSFILLATLAAIRQRRFDAVICCTTPPFLGLAGLLVTKLRGGALVLWMMDLYPDVAIAVQVIKEGSLRCRVLRALDRACLRRADAVVVLGQRMRDIVLRKAGELKRLEVISVWADDREITAMPIEGSPLRAAWGLEGFFVIQYSGNFGLGHEGRTMFEARKSFRDAPNVRWLFVGGGRKRVFLDRFIQETSVGNVEVRPYQPRDVLSQTLAVGNAHLVSVDRQLAGMIVPSKFYGALAAGRPVLYVGPRATEIADTIEELQCGFVIQPGCAADLVRAIEQLQSDPKLAAAMGARARAGLEARYSRRIACEHWSRLTAEVVAERARARADARAAQNAGCCDGTSCSKKR